MKRFLLVLLSFSCFFCHGQNNNAPDTVEKKVKNLIKWDYSLLARGVFMLNYERRLSQNISIELGAGITYSDFIFASYYINEHVSNSATFPSGPFNDTTYSLIGNPFSGAKKVGLAIDFSQRFYLNKNCPNGLYLSPYISYRLYEFSLSEVNTSADVYSNSNSSYQSNKEFNNLSYSFMDIGEKIGYQNHFKRKQSIYYDFYFELAYRRVLLNTLQRGDATAEYAYIDDATGHIYYYNVATTTYSEYLQKLNLLQIMLGAKIGFGK